jgi:hypothetical protein
LTRSDYSQEALTSSIDVNQVATLRVNFTGYPLELFEKKIDLDHVTYYAAHLVFKFIVKGMDLVAEVWWDDHEQRMDSFVIKTMPSSANACPRKIDRDELIGGSVFPSSSVLCGLGIRF